METMPEPKLAPPGAGLPWPELLIGRLIFSWQRRTATRETINARFQGEREKIRHLLRGCDAVCGCRRVLIRRASGMEDSSRYWSVAMVLDHLRIVHNSMNHVIGALAKGIALPGKGSTASVKPDARVTMAVLLDYEKSCDDLLATVAGVSDLQTPQHYEHPWFGLLDAAGWHALAASHIKIHRAQLERIIAGLNKQSGSFLM